MYFLYTFLLCSILPLAFPLFYFFSKRGNIRGTLKDRFGFVSFPEISSGRKKIWIHAASVGEVRTAMGLIHGILQTPDVQPAIFISVITKTGYEIARGEESLAHVFYLPVDIPFIIRKVLKSFKPDILIVFETELWPNLFKIVRKSGSKLMIANARISQNSLKGYRNFKFFMKQVLENCDRICVQNEIYQNRYLEIGAQKHQLKICGDIKDQQSLKLAEEFRNFEVNQVVSLQNKIVLAAVSTHPGEENLICDAFLKLQNKIKNLFLIIAPRHIHRKDEIAQVFNKYKISFVRRSEKKVIYSDREDAILWDTFGELGIVYKIASVVFVGGSLVPVGGHSLMEPAAFGKPVIWGPHVYNFTQASAKLLDFKGGIRVADLNEFLTVISNLLKQEKHRDVIGKNAKACVEQSVGAVERHLECINSLYSLNN